MNVTTASLLPLASSLCSALRGLALLGVGLAAVSPVPATAREVRDPKTSPKRLMFDGPLWDIANEGMPFRFTLTVPARVDPITRFLQGTESRWTFNGTYARVYNSYDRATGAFKEPGADAIMFAFGRQTLWELPPLLGPFTPAIELELAVNYSSHDFPADGTRFNFPVLTGFEWKLPKRGNAEWVFGIRWHHQSNADVVKPNAGFDGIAFRIGRTVEF